MRVTPRPHGENKQRRWRGYRRVESAESGNDPAVVVQDAALFQEASDTMMAHPLALQLRNLQTLVELGVDKNTTVVFPAPLMSAIGDIGSFFARETAAASAVPDRRSRLNSRIPSAHDEHR